MFAGWVGCNIVIWIFSFTPWILDVEPSWYTIKSNIYGFGWWTFLIISAAWILFALPVNLFLPAKSMFRRKSYGSLLGAVTGFSVMLVFWVGFAIIRGGE
jgi:hypothetical protein